MILATAVLAAVWSVTGTLAWAAQGQCTVTGYDTFDCDVALDGNGLSFELPDGNIFVFTIVGEGVGTAFLIAEDAGPGQRPEELREFVAVEDQPGCFARDEEFQFCVLLEQ